MNLFNSAQLPSILGKALFCKALRAIGLGFQQSYPQKFWTSFKAFEIMSFLAKMKALNKRLFCSGSSLFWEHSG